MRSSLSRLSGSIGVGRLGPRTFAGRLCTTSSHPTVQLVASTSGQPLESVPCRNIYCVRAFVPLRRVLSDASCPTRPFRRMLPNRNDDALAWQVGRNYAAHARELNNPVPKEEPVIFLKSAGALRGLESGNLAFASEVFHHEIELVVLVGSHVPLGGLEVGAELDCLKAVGLGLDLTRRGKQSELKAKGLPWAVAKSFAGSALLSPMSTLDGSFDLNSVSFELSVNGTSRQRGHVNQMIFDVPFLLRYLNASHPLLPGDLVFTGTPEGVGELQRGDEFTMEYHTGPPAGGPFHGVL